VIKEIAGSICSRESWMQGLLSLESFAFRRRGVGRAGAQSRYTARSLFGSLHSFPLLHSRFILNLVRCTVTGNAESDDDDSDAQDEDAASPLKSVLFAALLASRPDVAGTGAHMIHMMPPTICGVPLTWHLSSISNTGLRRSRNPD
jgi:hypothetical protein